MYCRHCGTEIADDANFCATCGKVIEQAGGAPNVAAPTESLNSSKIVEEISKSVVFETAALTSAPEMPIEDNPHKKANKHKRIIIAVVVAVVIIVIGIVGFMAWNAEQERLAEERYAQVIELAAELLDEAATIEPNTDKGADRTVLLEQYNTLLAADLAVTEAQNNGDLTLKDGKEYDITARVTDLRAKIELIRDWFLRNYNELLTARSFPNDATADTMSSTDCQAKLDQLADLLALLDNEIIIWNGNTDIGSNYSVLVEAINNQIAKGNELLPLIIAREEEARQRKFIGSWIPYGIAAKLRSGEVNGIGVYPAHFFANGTGIYGYPGTYYFTWEITRVDGNDVYIATHGTTKNPIENGTAVYCYHMNTDTLEFLSPGESKLYERNTL